jgi:hypothetical protein
MDALFIAVGALSGVAYNFISYAKKMTADDTPNYSIKMLVKTIILGGISGAIVGSAGQTVSPDALVATGQMLETGGLTVFLEKILDGVYNKVKAITG